MGEDTIRQQELEQKRRDWNTHITSWQASQKPAPAPAGQELPQTGDDG